MPARRQPPGATTAAGLGWEHQQARAAALAALRPGEPCALCRQPMYRSHALDLDHVRPRALGGKDGPRRLAHSACNRRAGAELGNRLRGERRAGGRKVTTRRTPPPATQPPEW